MFGQTLRYGVASISRLLKMMGLFCKRALRKRIYSEKRPIISRSLLIVATPYIYVNPPFSPLFKQNVEVFFFYRVATIRRLLQITGLFCRISSVLQGSFAKETYHFKEPTNLATAQNIEVFSFYFHKGDKGGCTYIFIYVHVYMHTERETKRAIYAYIYIYIHVCVYIHIFVHKFTYRYVYTNIYIYMYVYI